MEDLPLIEWPERHDSLEEMRIAEAIVNLLETETQRHLSTSNCFYLISPHPAHNIEVLTEALTRIESSIESSDKWQALKYGYKDRGWGLVFGKTSSLNFLLPVFFQHGSENLVIAAIENENNILGDSSALSELVKEIVLGPEVEPGQGGYVGLLFDCNSLTKIFE